MSMQLGFLGYGNMASAIVEGLLEKGEFGPKSMLAYDPAAARAEAAEALGIGLAAGPEALAREADVLVLAVKPQQMATALEQIRPGLRPETLIISIAAGISTAYIRARLGATARVIRVMPNTPAMVQAGAAGVAAGAGCTEDDIALALRLFEAIGLAVRIEESQMDALTALSGSGPAYFFFMVECLIDAAVAEGLPRETAAQLAAQTLFGAGKLLICSDETPGDLRRKVTSPGGTTEAALRRFKEGGLESLVREAVAAAVRRSQELGARE